MLPHDNILLLVLPLFSSPFTNLAPNCKLMKTEYNIAAVVAMISVSTIGELIRKKKQRGQNKIFFTTYFHFFPWFLGNLDQNIWNFQKKSAFSIYNTENDSRNMGFVRQSQKISTSECFSWIRHLIITYHN